MAHIDASLMQQIFDIPKRERETDVHITAKRMISGLVLKFLNGDCLIMREGYESTCPHQTKFF